MVRLSAKMVDPRVWYRPHAKQKAFHALGATCRERLFLAGNRVGKTVAGATEMAFHLMGVYPDWWEGLRCAAPIEAWAASVTKEATRDILQAAYIGRGRQKGVIPPGMITHTTHRAGVPGAVDRIAVRHISGGVSTLGFKSYDQGRETFQGTSRHVIHLDEEPDVDVYEECLLRTLTVGGQVMLTMTPLKGVTAMVRHFTEAARGEGKGLVQAGWSDATHLKPADTTRLRASLRPHEVAAREFGKPQLGRGMIFPVVEKDIGVPRFEVPVLWRRCVGLDFGWSNPTAAVWLAHDVADDVVYVTDVYTRSEATPAEHAVEIIRRGAWVPAVCDPSGQAGNVRDGTSLMQLYAEAGLYLSPADNAVEGGLMSMLERMRSGRFKVFDDLLPWWHEFRSYVRDERGHIVKKNDHLMDATRYAVVSGLPLARSEGEMRAAAPRRRGGWMGV